MHILHFYHFQEQNDVHLKDYDTEIFDDDDFYHQVFYELHSCNCYVAIAVEKLKLLFYFQINGSKIGSKSPL